MQNLMRIITEKTGMQIKGSQSIKQKIQRYLQEHTCTEQQLCNLLETNSLESKKEWEQLVDVLTIGESYFFRDTGQFKLLRETILPQLISQQRKDKTLHIWSAGCSSGQEVYSLAILVNELLPQWHKWNISILGTDINQKYLKEAQQATYSDWSFRLDEFKIRDKYFYKKNNEWQLKDKIRTMANFRYCNLHRDKFQYQNIHLIICRNVFIYFSSPVVNTIAKKFALCLASNGFLITGHNEIPSYLKIPNLKTTVFLESIVYQREKASLTTNHTKITQTTPVLHKNNSLLHIQKLLDAREHYKAIEKAKNYIDADDSKNLPLHILLAQAYANTGEYKTAISLCKQVLAQDNLMIQPYYLLAQIAELQGHLEEAKVFLKKIIYLDPRQITAYLELSEIYKIKKENENFIKIRYSMLELLQKLPDDLVIEGKNTVKELISYIKKETQSK
ncbi:CheR family methyltransferase [Candidatus Uabimicrobium sp. HlEnr_7]|uniref:CheR family methyltransferase n=1 Tax=Candidatus Uabimicrobium helgolandensis TaxID=3095367 RepID=UPI003557A946